MVFERGDYQIASAGLPHPEVDEAYVALLRLKREYEERLGSEEYGVSYYLDMLSHADAEGAEDWVADREEGLENTLYFVERQRGSLEIMGGIVLDFYKKYQAEIHENALSEDDMLSYIADHHRSKVSK